MPVPARPAALAALTAIDLAKIVGWPEKRFRQWLRDEKQGGFAPLVGHRKNDLWLFTHEEAVYVVMHWRGQRGQINWERTLQQLSAR